ncbi:MAG: hypothetical protein LE178_01365 [Endomicrobium sp.]|nr:hypothetical protein [Endomicrobium sp.]
MKNENNRNAYVGMNIETLIKNSIVDHPSVINKIKRQFNINGKLDNTSKAGIYRGKSDVRIAFTCGHYVDANIKGYKTGFNQLTRTSVAGFCKKFGLDNKDKQELENIIIAKSRNPKNSLFSEQNQKKWDKFFREKAKVLLEWGFSDHPSREILVIYDINSSIVRIYPMKKVLSKLSTEIKFTKGGLNIGKCISFQRKGGNGSMSKTVSKTSIKHPGNNVQLKLKIVKMIPLLDNVKLAEYTI